MKEITRVQKNILIQASPERVWQALTIPEERNKWETQNCEIDLRVGGKIYLDYGWGVTYEGTIIEIEVNTRLVIEDEEKGLTIWSIAPQADGSLVTIEYTGRLWTGDKGIMYMENMLFGTYQFMRNFKSVLEQNGDIRHTFWQSWIGMNHRTTIYEESTAIKVVEIIPGSSSDGLLQEGDLIFSLNGSTIRNYDDFETMITEIGPNREVELSILRDGSASRISLVTLPYGSKVNPTPTI
jgi:uncharacterized protein YndB with AHSA1/START domain